MPNENNQPKIRLFTALTVPVDLRAQLAALPHKGLDAKWSHVEDFHITIRFLGDLEPERLPEIEQALSRVRRAPFGAEVQGLGVFENKHQSILHAKVQSVRKMEALCADITDELVPLGFDFGARAFVPHVTLARLKGASRGLDAYMARHGRAIAARWQVLEFHLMLSASPDEGGRRYTVVHSYPLRA